MFSYFIDFIQAFQTRWDCVPKQCLHTIQEIRNFWDEQRLIEQGLGPTFRDDETNLEVVSNLDLKREAPRFTFEEYDATTTISNSLFEDDKEMINKKL